MNNETNDQRILLLKKQIEDKKAQLNKSLRFTPITNCSIEVEGVRYNIQVLTREQLIMLMIKLNLYQMSAKDLNILNEFNICGYSVQDWIIDIKAKIDILSRKEEEKSLKAMEDKLIKLLSDGKKVELELNEIESILKI
jgi:hypothetical protein